MDIFTQPVAVDECRFEFLFDANPANGDPLRLHYGTYWNTSLTFIGQSVIMLVPSVAKMKRQQSTMENYNNCRQSMCQ